MRERSLCRCMRRCKPGRAVLTFTMGYAKFANTDALSSMSARSARGDSQLAKLIREEQDLIASAWAHSSLDQAAAGTDAAVHAAISGIEARLWAKQEQLRREFPDYAELAIPKPLPLAGTQSLLAPDEALVTFLDVPGYGHFPEENYVWVVTKTNSRWVRSKLGTESLKERVGSAEMWA
jgi:hypothetical protein